MTSAIGGPDGAAWHEALGRGEFLLPQCEACGQYRFPPMPACPHCGAPGAGRLVAASGLGTVYSWVVVHIALDQAFADEVPYAIVSVDLDEGPRVFARFAGSLESLSPDLPVVRVPAETHEGPILCFGPAAA